MISPIVSPFPATTSESRRRPPQLADRRALRPAHAPLALALVCARVRACANDLAVLCRAQAALARALPTRLHRRAPAQTRRAQASRRGQGKDQEQDLGQSHGRCPNVGKGRGGQDERGDGERTRQRGGVGLQRHPRRDEEG